MIFIHVVIKINSFKVYPFINNTLEVMLECQQEYPQTSLGLLFVVVVGVQKVLILLLPLLLSPKTGQNVIV